jgi:hypothetical protein
MPDAGAVLPLPAGWGGGSLELKVMRYGLNGLFAQAIWKLPQLLGVWSRILMAQSCRKPGEIRYGANSTWKRPHDRGGTIVQEDGRCRLYGFPPEVEIQIDELSAFTEEERIRRISILDNKSGLCSLGARTAFPSQA